MPSTTEDSSTVIVSGRVTFDRLPFKPSGNGLDIASPITSPPLKVYFLKRSTTLAMLFFQVILMIMVITRLKRQKILNYGLEFLPK
jgi:hypothetical protein